MEDRSGGTRRLNAGRRLLGNSRQALRAGVQSLPATTVKLLRRVPPAVPPPRPADHPAPGSRTAMDRGAQFAGYTILRQPGAGGMAEVYLALHPGCRAGM